MYILSDLKTLTLCAVFASVAPQSLYDANKPQIDTQEILEPEIIERTCSVLTRSQKQPLKVWQNAYNHVLKTKNPSKFGLNGQSKVSEISGGLMVITPDDKCYLIKQHILL